MEIIDSADFTAGRAWGSRELMAMAGHAARLHWTVKPYRWHQNTGHEVFVVLDGVVDMLYIGKDGERAVALHPGQIAVIGAGEFPVAQPCGEARVLVIERTDSD